MNNATPESIHKKNIVRMLLIGLLSCLCGALVLLLYFSTRLKTTPLKEQSLGRGIVAVKHLSTTEPYVTFYRLRDGQAQTATGTFEYIFTQPHEVIVFGYAPEKPSEQMAFIMDDEKIRLKNISGLPGPIQHITASQNNFYLLISGISNKDTKPYHCVVTRAAENYSSCRSVEEIFKNTPHQGPLIPFWEKSKNAELIIQETSSSSRTFWRYLPSSKNLSIVTSSPSELQPKISFAPLHYDIQRFGPIVIAKDTTTKKRHIFLLPSSQRILELADGHFLALGADQSFIINPALRTISAFSPLPPSSERTVLVY